MVVMIVFTMMAVGLNIVVGYAGLLDLGYVAFYAAGAYTAGWFASGHFEHISFHFLSTAPEGATGIHVSMWLVLIIAGVFTTLVGILIGLPTLRLRGDYLAIVTLGFGEIVPQFVRNGDSLGGFDLTNGTFGISPIDSLGVGDFVFRSQSNRAELFYWTAVGLLLFTVFCCVRLERSRLGRAWIAIREDETAAAAMGDPADADEDLGVCDRRVLRRRRRSLLRELQVRRLPGGLLLQHLGLPALHGHPRRDGQSLGGDPRRDDPRLPQHRGPCHDRLEDPGGRARLRSDEVPVRDLRGDHRR